MNRRKLIKAFSIGTTFWGINKIIGRTDAVSIVSESPSIENSIKSFDHEPTHQNRNHETNLPDYQSQMDSTKQSLKKITPIVLSTWHNQGVASNTKAWEVLNQKGNALDAVEQGAKMSELDENNCCVGLGANPDREGIVTLDACIMNSEHQCGSVLALERIKHPISVARKVMENTPHVVLTGEGAQQFAICQGFELQAQVLSPQAQKNYDNWLKKSEYRPQINIERNEKNIAPPSKMDGGEFNHDTIGVIAMDSNGNFSGACTTSGMAFKMRGRIGDSPLISAGLYVDNEIGAATCSGLGEEVIRCCGSFLVVEYMRQGYHPTEACKKTLERIVSKSKLKASEFQVGFIAINKKGEFGGYSINPNFDFTVTTPQFEHEKRIAKSLYN